MARALFYYDQRRLNYKLVIADSSQPDFCGKNQLLVDSLKRNLKIEYKKYESNIEIARKLQDVLGCVETRYTVLGGDDDFFIPRALGRAVEFLETHSDYSVAHGDAAGFTLKSDRVYGQIAGVSRYNQTTVDHESAAKRVYDHLAGYSATWYSVQRTDQLRKNFRKAAEFGDIAYFAELLTSCLSLVQGKVKKLDGLYMIRQCHPENKYGGPDLFDWVTSPRWGSQYERFRDCLVAELTQRDGIDIHQTQAMIKRTFWFYLATGFHNQWKDCYPTHGSLPPSDVSLYLHGLRKIGRMLRSLIVRKSEPEISLPALLNVSSPYYADFQPIYRAITTVPTEFASSVS